MKVSQGLFENISEHGCEQSAIIRKSLELTDGNTDKGDSDEEEEVPITRVNICDDSDE